MGKGIEAARALNPEHAQAIDDMKDQLLIVLVNRLGGSVAVPVEEIDATGSFTMSLRLDVPNRTFHFVVGKKQ